MPVTAETRRRPVLTIAALAALLVMAAAVSFARSDQSLRVADDAMIVRDAERGQAAAATYRANLTIAVVATATGSPSSAQQAVEAAESALESVVDATASLPSLELRDTARTLEDSHARVATALGDGDVATADRLVSSETLQVLDTLQLGLSSASAAAESRIEAEQASAGRTARMSSFLVALIAPMLALWAYRRSVQRRMEHDRLAAELARQRDLAAAQQSLISGMSHQLRTPLTGIYGFAEALVSDSGLTSDPLFVHEAGTTILGEANRLRGMVDDILVTARGQADDLAYEHARFRLVTEVDAAVDPFRTIGAKIEFDCDETEILGDRHRLRHVLRNLIDNALRHGLAPVHITGRLRPDGYDLTVIDHGTGPPLDDLFRTFAHSGEDALVTGSLGLGLGVCRALCDGMGIELSHERTDETTRFNLRFGRPSLVVSNTDGSFTVSH